MKQKQYNKSVFMFIIIVILVLIAYTIAHLTSTRDDSVSDMIVDQQQSTMEDVSDSPSMLDVSNDDDYNDVN